jgi:hypothetical protein
MVQQTAPTVNHHRVRRPTMNRPFAPGTQRKAEDAALTV